MAHHRMVSFEIKYSLVFAFALAVCAMGCKTVRYGGAPEPSFSITEDLKALEQRYSNAASIDGFYNDPTLAARNKFISARLVMMNIRYIEFVRSTTQEKQLLDSASDILVLSLNLAGAAFSDKTTKTALAAISAAVAGSRIVIDKEFYFEKTVPALVAAMNAQRRVALIPLLEGSRKPLAEYSLEHAIVDLNQYYLAGTYLGALQAIQADAAVKEADASTVIATLVPLSPEAIDKKGNMTDAIGALKEADLVKATAALKTMEPDAAAPKTIKEAQERLQKQVRQARTPQRVDDLHSMFTSAGLVQ